MASLFQGVRELGQDWNAKSFDSDADLTPAVSGTANIVNGVTLINYSGAVTVVVPSGFEKSNREFIVKDIAGHASAANITVSGTNGETFNGDDAIVISSDYGFVRLGNFDGSTDWYTI